MAARHDESPRALVHSKRRDVKRKRRGTGLTRKVEKALEELVWNDKITTLKAAAEAAGMTDRALRMALRKGPVIAHYRAELALLRDGEKAANLKALAGIRDDNELKETAAGQTARIKAIQALEGPQEGQRHMSFNMQVNAYGGRPITPGYIIDLTKYDDEAGSKPRAPIVSDPDVVGQIIDVTAKEASE